MSVADPGLVDPLVVAAQQGDAGAFDELVRRHRRELQVHCYRMVGSLTESEDLVQETFLRAWRKLDTFEGRSSLRAWLYRIATNACLDAVTRRPRRVLPYDVAPATPPGHQPPGAIDYLPVEPYPDQLLDELASDDGAPEGVVVERETIELAFLAAIQHLPPRQRAVLILRDVLGWPAKEAATLLDISVAAVKSSLQRSRPTLRAHLPARRHEWAAAAEASETERELLQRYIRAHEQDDGAALAAVLREDVRVSYPPEALWRDSRDAFIRSSAEDAPPGEYRFVPTRANMQPAVAIYRRDPGDTRFMPIALEVLRIEGDVIAEIVDFEAPALVAAFGLPAWL